MWRFKSKEQRTKSKDVPICQCGNVPIEEERTKSKVLRAKNYE